MKRWPQKWFSIKHHDNNENLPPHTQQSEIEFCYVDSEVLQIGYNRHFKSAMKRKPEKEEKVKQLSFVVFLLQEGNRVPKPIQIICSKPSSIKLKWEGAHRYIQCCEIILHV